MAVVRLLVEKGADPSAETKDGWTPLHAAAEHRHQEIVEFLIAKGADVNAASRSLTPLDLVEDKEVTGLLREHGAKTGKELAAEREP